MHTGSVSELAYIELNDGADDRLSQLADEVSRTGGRVVLTRNGKPLLVAMSPDELARIHRFALIVGGLPNEQMPSYLRR